MQHNTSNDFPIGTSCCFPNSTFNDISMTYIGIYCVREQKSKKIVTKIVLKKQTSWTLFFCFSPWKKQNLSSNSHLNLSQHNINEYIQQYNVPGLKADTVYVTI